MADPIGYISPKERSHSEEEILRTALDSFKSSIWTSIPCIVQSFDHASNTITAQPCVAGIQTSNAGSQSAVNMPILVDIPVVFPSGGGAYFTMPVRIGDEALIVFSCRDIDSWFLYGGVNNIPMSNRRVSLSDGFAFVGPMSQPKTIANISTAEAQIRNSSGTAFIALNPTTGAVRITAPGGITIVGDITQTGNTNQTGSVVVSTDVTANGKSLVHHIHSDAQGGNTGQPS